MKIGFIDYYLDEWHANAYPKMIREASNGEIEAVYAYGQVASPLTGRDSKAWCERRGLTYCESIAEVIEKSDALVVLSPDNVEMKEALSKLALMSGKPTYVDKTFAPDKRTAEAMFALAEANHTPCYSTSALRFAAEYQPYRARRIEAMSMVGGCDVDTYVIHQLEPMVMLMGCDVKRVMALNRNAWTHVMLEWEGGRVASILCTGAEETPFSADIYTENGCEKIDIKSSYFDAFISNLVRFVKTGEIPVCHRETIAIMALRAAILNAQKRPGEWVDVE